MLAAEGYEVVVLDNLLYGDKGVQYLSDLPSVHFIRGDVTDPDTVDRALCGVQRVIALAAIVGDPACDINEELTRRINYDSIKLLVDRSIEHGVKRLVFASSCSVYGANGSELLCEDSHLNPVSLYARTRLMSEELLLREAGDVEVVILRLATVCGVSPRMRFDLMVNTMTACAKMKGSIRVTGADQWRPHLHVTDAAEAFARAVAADPSMWEAWHDLGVVRARAGDDRAGNRRRPGLDARRLSCRGPLNANSLAEIRPAAAAR